VFRPTRRTGSCHQGEAHNRSSRPCSSHRPQESIATTLSAPRATEVRPLFQRHYRADYSTGALLHRHLYRILYLIQYNAFFYIIYKPCEITKKSLYFITKAEKLYKIIIKYIKAAKMIFQTTSKKCQNIFTHFCLL
jgi:hypothetical protein